MCCYDNSELWNLLLIITTQPPPEHTTSTQTHHRPQERALLVKCVFVLSGWYILYLYLLFSSPSFLCFVMSNSWYNISYNISLACSVPTSSSHPVITGVFSLSKPPQGTKRPRRDGDEGESERHMDLRSSTPRERELQEANRSLNSKVYLLSLVGCWSFAFSQAFQCPA